MANGLLHCAGAALCLVTALACCLAQCDFQPECRPGETYRLGIPCEGKCSSYVQCQDGVATEKKCGKFFWHQNEFDEATLDCVRDADCNWWKKIVTTTTTPPSSTTSAPVTTTPFTTTTSADTTSPSTSTSTTEQIPTTTGAATNGTTIVPDTTSAAPSTTPSSSVPPPPPPEPTAAAAPSAVTGVALLATCLALLVL